MSYRDTALELAVKAMPGRDPAAIAEAARIFERYLTGETAADQRPAGAAKIGDDVRILKINDTLAKLEGSVIVLARAIHATRMMSAFEGEVIREGVDLVANCQLVTLNDLMGTIRLREQSAAQVKLSTPIPRGRRSRSPARKKTRA